MGGRQVAWRRRCPRLGQACESSQQASEEAKGEGADPQDKPTLHLGAHHLLHGKVASLPKPLAVIRRAEATGEVVQAEEQADGTPGRPRGHIEGDASEEEEDEDEYDEAHEREDNEEAGPSRPTRHYTTPSRPSHAGGSSPILPPSAIRDYSSDLDYSSPYRAEMDGLGFDGPSQQTPIGKEGGDESDEDDVAREADELRKRRAAREELAAQARKRKKRRVDRGEKERTRFYEVVGVVRKKVVFSLRSVAIGTGRRIADPPDLNPSSLPQCCPISQILDIESR